MKNSTFGEQFLRLCSQVVLSKKPAMLYWLAASVLFSRDNRELDLHLVPEVFDLCAACDNVLSAPGGSLLLAGSSGVGRRAAVSVVSALHRAKLVTLNMGKGYTIKQFRTDLKSAMHSAGVSLTQFIFCFQQHQVNIFYVYFFWHDRTNVNSLIE